MIGTREITPKLQLNQDDRSAPEQTGDNAVLVISCDKYQDLWASFFILFFRYWPDCPFPVYLVANHTVYSDNRVRTIKIGRDRNWSSNLAKALRLINSHIVLVVLEDYMLNEPVNTDRIMKLVEYMRRKEAGCLRLFPMPGPDRICNDNSGVGELAKGAPYRLSLQAALWDRETLLSLLRWGESAWELEVRGTPRTCQLAQTFLSVTTASPAISYLNAVVKGRWQPEVLEFCRKEGVPLDISRREIEGLSPLTPMSLKSRMMLAFNRRVLRKLKQRP